MSKLPKLGKGIVSAVHNDDINLSSVYEVYAGGFGSKKEFIETYITSKKISELKLDLITFESLLENKKWPISKILQREVSLERVEKIAKKYIQGNENVKFFPPIIVALIPRDGDNISNKYEKQVDQEYKVKALDQLYERSILSRSSTITKESFIEESKSLTRANGLFVQELWENINFNFLAWDKNNYWAILIDGQHRFEALKKASEDPTSDYSSYKQDVIFIDASNKYFKSDDIVDISPNSIFRKIFIDINRHPEQVSQSRQIIMDDLDVAALFVQSFVNDDQKDQKKYLWPELIDWHTSASKHELPYLTSILNLYWIFFEKILNKRQINSYEALRDKDNVEKWITQLNQYLIVDKTIDEKELNIKKLSDSFVEFEEAKKDDEYILFKYDLTILSVAKENFEEFYQDSFLYFFYHFKPYELLIEKLKNKGVFNRDNEINRIILHSQKNRKIIKNEDRLFNELKSEVEKCFSEDYNLVFTVVFQKAIIELFHKNISDKTDGEISNEKNLESTIDFITEVNGLFNDIIEQKGLNIFGNSYENENYSRLIKKSRILKEYRALSPRFWDDILYYDNNIKYNNIGIGAIKRIVEYLLHCYRFEDYNDLINYGVIQLGEFRRRIVSRLSKEYEVTDNEQAEKIAKEYLKIKSNYLKQIIIAIKWRDIE